MTLHDRMFEKLDYHIRKYKEVETDYWEEVNRLETFVRLNLCGGVTDGSVYVSDNTLIIKMENLTPEFEQFKELLEEKDVLFLFNERDGRHYFKVDLWEIDTLSRMEK